MTFQEGDVVSRVTGSCLMTVEVIDARADGLVSCVWHNVSGDVQRDAFAACTLRKWTLSE